MTAWMLESALRALMMGAVVWTGIKLLRVRDVVVQKTAWVLVLIASIAMPGLMRWSALQSKAPVVVPVRAAQEMQEPLPAVREPARQAAREITLLPSYTEAMTPVQRWSASQWKSLVGPGYIAVSSILLLRLMIGLIAAGRIRRRAEDASVLLDPRATVRISGDIETPVTIGSAIVLPESYEEWDKHKLRVVLAHERSHVRQRDFYLHLAAGLYTTMFWFNPLSWWLKKEIADLGEAISDRAALAEAASRATYAEVLVEFAAIRRKPMAGVAMARSGNLRRRVDRLLVEQKFRSAFTPCRWHLAAAAALVPGALVIAVTLVRVQTAEAMQVPEKMTPVVRAVTKAVAAIPSVQAAHAPAHAMAAAQTKPAQPPVEVQESTGDDDNSYAIVTGGSTSRIGSWHSGDSFDQVKSKMHGDYIWFERDGKSYVIDDPALVSQAKEYFKPMEELGRRQGELAKQQGELGKEQARLGEMEAGVSGPPPDLSKELAEAQQALKKLQEAKIDQQLKQEDMSDIQSKLADVQAKLAEAQGKFGDAQAKLGEKQAEFGEQQAKLGEKQAALGQQQAALGEQQAQIAHAATQKVKALIDNAFQSGKARPIQ